MNINKKNKNRYRQFRIRYALRCVRIRRAIEAGNLKVLKKIKFNQDLMDESLNNMGVALTTAAYFGSLEIVKYLVSLGASPRHRFCLCLSAMKNNRKNTETFSYLLSVGVKATTSELNEPLISASRCGNLDIVKICIEQGCDISFRNYRALGEAGEQDQVEVLEYFATKVLTPEYLEQWGIYGRRPLGYQSRLWWEVNKDTIVQRRKTIALYDSIQSKCQDKTVSKPRLKI
ncbi:ankyrin repeat domain-containing protein [Burkholderia cepacia]|uniref:ankyrin repeat domain-containing protein n=1 Tax=Burkholderia cepacia TaxID=292 RepID=UPI0026E0385F|nr:ankyrin repeat domain-containing protein [Burkholderia cepacia]MDO5943339.1 ankyrin repeat domain-containing protein [Burkholderia cepacia]